jgi:N4-gp56 family major capsid protein
VSILAGRSDITTQERRKAQTEKIYEESTMLTNFSRLTSYEKTVWARKVWRQGRTYAFINNFLGEGPDSMIQRITELRKDEKGSRAVITLLADLKKDGVAGDRTLEGNEEAMATFDQLIRMDQIRHAVRHEGRMANQKSVVEFRGNAKNALSFWLSDRIDQMAFLTLAGISYTKNTDGSARALSAGDIPFLEFAGDVTAPSAKRRLRWDNTAGALVPAAATTAVTATDKLTWRTIVMLKAYAKMRRIRPVGGPNGTYHLFVTPMAMASLKKDTEYLEALRHAAASGKGNPLFTGKAVEVDGVMIHEYIHVPNTLGLTSGNKFGSGGTIDGAHLLFCGAQALGFADLGTAYWDEEGFDYSNQQGISYGKILGLKKPVFSTMYEADTEEDFGVIVCYVAE